MTSSPQPKRSESAPSRRDEIGDESRKRILDAAERLFIERGVSSTSFARIEREAGISRGSIPWHFTNKRGLLLSILDRAMVMSSTEVSDLHGRDGVRQAISRAQDRLHRPQAVLLAALLGESLHVESDTHSRYREFHKTSRANFADVVRDADDVKLPAGLDPDAFGTILFAALIGIHLQFRIAPDLVDLDGAIDDLIALVDVIIDPNNGLATPPDAVDLTD